MISRRLRRLVKKQREREERRGRLPSRRRFLLASLSLLGLGAALTTQLLRPGRWLVEKFRRPIRPPTADADDARFQAACIRCGLCSVVCDAGCIETFGADEPTWGALTPFLDVRRRSCTLCMKCTEVCPTGALQPVEADLKVIQASVVMGTAIVDPDRCLSYLGRVCGYCHDACPFPNVAIKLMPPAKPVVLEDGCVGCGRCVELCPQVPTAIDVRRLDT
jgi:ferredoxin-type protein NapG